MPACLSAAISAGAGGGEQGNRGVQAGEQVPGGQDVAGWPTPPVTAPVMNRGMEGPVLIVRILSGFMGW